MTAPDPRLGEIEDRLSKATPGRWYAEGEPGDVKGIVNYKSENGISVGTFITDFVEKDADAEFIAAAPADIAYLLAELRKAQDALGRVEGLCGSWQAMATTTNTADTTLRATVYAIRAAVAAATGGGDRG